MKKPYKHLAVLGTLCCISALGVLISSVLTMEWLIIHEPKVDQLEMEKLNSYEEPKPHILTARLGLFRICIQTESQLRKSTECHEFDWLNFGIVNFNPTKRTPPMPTELIANCLEKLRITLPFIGFSVIFTSAAFLCLIFGHFCSRNRKIIEATMLILGGLCQATALLTFVSQIGSEFEANLPFSPHTKGLTTFYHYKYGYSFYLFLLSFSLSELAALFDMAAYFRKFPPNHYVITFHRQEPSPFLGQTSTTNTNNTNSLNNRSAHTTAGLNGGTSTMNGNGNHIPYPHNGNGNGSHHPYNHHQYNNSYTSYGSLTHPNHNNQQNKNQQQHQMMMLDGGPPGPDICCNEFMNNSDHIVDLTISARQQQNQQPQFNHGLGGQERSLDCYINPEVTIAKIERNTTGCYATLRAPKISSGNVMESFGTLPLRAKENNI